MAKVTFLYPVRVKVTCAITGFTGIITGRIQHLNGSIQYSIQPPVKKGSSFIPDGYTIDEANIKDVEIQNKETVQFKFQGGDRVKSRVNGFEGIITKVVQHMNGCLAYVIEGPMREGKEVLIKAWEQELQLVDRGLNAPAEEPVARKRTGGPSTRERLIDKAM